MATVYHRRFFPDDVDGSIAYVAPNDVVNSVDAYDQFFEHVGSDPACQESLPRTFVPADLPMHFDPFVKAAALTGLPGALVTPETDMYANRRLPAQLGSDEGARLTVRASSFVPTASLLTGEICGPRGRHELCIRCSARDGGVPCRCNGARVMAAAMPKVAHPAVPHAQHEKTRQ